MRVLILTNNDMGLYKFRRELILELIKSNEVYISLPYGKYVDLLVEDGCRYTDVEFSRRGKNPFDDMMLLLKYLKMIKSINPDVVLTYTIKPNVYGGFACRLLKKPYIANVTGLGTTIENGGMLSLLTTAMYKVGLKRACCVFFQNSENKKFFQSKGITGRKSFLLPGSGVNTDTNCYEEYPNYEGIFNFLFIGRIMTDKGINELLEASKELSKKYNLQIGIVGACDEDYEQLINEDEKKGFIKWYGLQDDVHPFIKRCHCVVLPSYHEGMANVLLEASSTGRPVIASNIPGCKEIVEDGCTGFLCESKSTYSLMQGMEKIINLSQEERKLMGVRAREKVMEEFDRKKVINAYLEEINCIRIGNVR